MYINKAKKEIYTLIKKYSETIQPRGYVIWHCLKIKRVNANFYKILEKNDLKELRHNEMLPDEILDIEKVEILDMTKDTFHEITNVFMIKIILRAVKEWAKEQEKKLKLKGLSTKL